MVAKGVIPVILDMPNSVSSKEVSRLATTYRVPLGSSFCATEDGEVMIIGGDNCMAVQVNSVCDGMRFSIHPLVRHLLQAANLAPMQLSPNSCKYIIGSLII